jgi:hypothetical protein
VAEDRGTDQIVLDEFGLLYNLGGEAQNVPKGRAQACPNVVAYPGRVASRPGFANVASFASLSVVGLKEYVLPDVASKRLLALTSDGTLYKETGTYSFSSVCAGFTEAAITARMMSVTQFGREYFALNDSGRIPYAMPKSFDDTNVDEVAPCRPEAAPSLSAGSAGTVSAGVHTVRIAYLTRAGFITAPGPAATLTASGTATISVTGIPTGPSYVTGRIICISPAGVPDLYYIPGTAMHIGDNTTTSVSNIDFTDTDLISGTPISIADDPMSDRLNLIELPSQTGVAAYHNRLVWYGERNAFYKVGDSGPRNFNFNGGWAASIPNGWTQHLSGQTKGSSDAGAYGEYLIITGDGTNSKGMLHNNAKVLSWPRIRPGVEVRCRVRVKKNAAAAAGTFHVYIVDTSAGSTVPASGASFAVSQMSTSEWRVLDAQVMPAASFTPATTWEVRISTGGTGSGTALSNTGTILVDFLEMYHGDKPYSYSQARWSRVGQPDAYDDVFGVMTVGFDDGQAIRSAFTIGDSVYFVKERSIYQCRDDGASEPAFWGVSPVSDAIGTPSQKGVGYGDQWAVIASRGGLYYFTGGTPIPMTIDIQDEWNGINWLYGHLIHVTVDIEKKRIYVGVPYGSATYINRILTFQWWGQNPAGATAAGATSAAQASPWYMADTATVGVPCAAISERSNGLRDFVIGTTHTSNNLGRLDSTAHSDTMGASTQAIASSYRTGPIGQAGKRLLFSRYTANFKGSGSLTTAVYLPDNATAITPAIPSYTLQSAPKGDQEWPVIRGVTERCFFDWSTNATGAWFSLSRFALFGKEKPGGGERGTRDY